MKVKEYKNYTMNKCKISFQSFHFMHKLSTHVVDLLKSFTRPLSSISSKKDLKISTTRGGELSIDGRREYRNA